MSKPKKQWKKQGSMLIFYCLTSCIVLVGQPAFLSKVSNYPNEVIQKAIQPALVILRQDYLLHDANDPSIQYTRGGTDFYGNSYTLGVISGSKIWTNSSTLEPWLFDKNYQDKKVGNLTKLGHYAIRTHDSKVFEVKGRGLSAKSINQKFIANYPLWDKTRGALKRYDDWQKTDLNGWMVLVYTQESLSEIDTSYVKYAIYKEKIKLEANQQEVLINPKVKSNLIGGIYLVPEYNIGKITFKVAGILLEKPAVFSWFLQLFDDFPLTKPIENGQLTDFPIRVRFVDKHERPYKNQPIKIKLGDNSSVSGLINDSGILTMYAEDGTEQFISINDVGALYAKSDDRLYTLFCKKTKNNILIPSKIIMERKQRKSKR